MRTLSAQCYSTVSDINYSKKAGPCGVSTGLDIGLSNLSLKSITLSFYSEALAIIVRHSLSVCSYVQIIVTRLCPPLCLPLSPRATNLALSGHYHRHHRRSRPHGFRRDEVLLHWHDRSAVSISNGWTEMGAHSKAARQGSHGPQQPFRNAFLAGTNHGRYTSVL